MKRFLWPSLWILTTVLLITWTAVVGHVATVRAQGSGPILQQIEAVVNPQTNKIHLFGVTVQGRSVSYSAATGTWIDIDQSEAGYVD